MYKTLRLGSLLILFALVLVGCNLGASPITEIAPTEVLIDATRTPVPPTEVSATVTQRPATSVPTAVLPPTQAPDTDRCLATVEGNGYVTLSPSTPEPVTPNCVSVPVGEITVTWAEAPVDFVEVVFWTQMATGNTNVIGIDTDASDGASITWTTYAGAPPMVVYTMVLTSPPSAGNDSGYLAFYVE
ncbi:MAG: hypothetical protein AAFV98_21370 [Chloroflexota bacterium]